ncbi:C-5 cytosine-specific DNA methylase [Pseudomonas coronafaciens pv. atropurpurea]|nr:C-5 cytosine-specific DNA methylase [Pseudomonas coronafaciens pv. atropurpurea]
MLKPSDLYKAQGFPDDYVIIRGADGKPFTKTRQVHMCGNSVNPPIWQRSLERTTRGAHQLNIRWQHDQSILAAARQANCAPAIAALPAMLIRYVA